MSLRALAYLIVLAATAYLTAACGETPSMAPSAQSGGAQGLSGGTSNRSAGGTGNATLGGTTATSGGAPGGSLGGSAMGGSATGGSHASGGAPTSTSGGAASGGANAASGGSASIDYMPCPAKGTPCKIMPLGASIVFGVGSSDGGGFRVPLFAAAVARGQSITFVGSWEPSGPSMVSGLPFPRANEGHSGFRIADLSGLVDASLAANTPNIVLLHIGTNDAEEDQTDRPSPQELGALLDKICAGAPNALIVVAQLVPLNNDNAGLQQGLAAYNAAIPGLVAERAAAGKHIAVVNMNGPFVANVNYKTAYLVDDRHPNDAGYQVMADVWYQAIGALLR